MVITHHQLAIWIADEAIRLFAGIVDSGFELLHSRERYVRGDGKVLEDMVGIRYARPSQIAFEGELIHIQQFNIVELVHKPDVKVYVTAQIQTLVDRCAAYRKRKGL